MTLREELEEKKSVLASIAGKDFLTKALKDHFHAELIFISSNVEDVVVTREEVKDIVAQYPRFKSIPADRTPLLQAKGQKIALEHVEDIAQGDQPITAETVREIHGMVFEEAAPEIAGKYREELIKIQGTEFLPTVHYFIPMEMKEFDARLRRGVPSMESSVWDMLGFATWAHYEVARIHPFKDGNGRTARILFNLICRRYDLPYVLVPKSGTEKKMREGLRVANLGDLDPLQWYYGELLRESYDFIIGEYQKKS